MSGTYSGSGNAPVYSGGGFGMGGAGAYPWGTYVFADPNFSAYQPISPDFLGALGGAFQNQINNSLAAVASTGFTQFTALNTSLGNWGQLQGSFETTVGNAFQEIADKSARACSGFFSCLFG